MLTEILCGSSGKRCLLFLVMVLSASIEVSSFLRPEDKIVDFTRNSKKTDVCPRRYILLRSTRCFLNNFRTAKLEDMEEFFFGLVAENQKHEMLTFILADDFKNFTIVTRINYIANEERYIMGFEPLLRPTGAISLCIAQVCPPTTLPPPTTQPVHPDSKAIALGTLSLTTTAATYSLFDPRYRWFTTAMFLTILCAIFFFVVVVLSIMLHKSWSREKFSGRPAVVVTSTGSHLLGHQRKSSISSSVVHVPRAQLDAASVGYFGDIERRKMRSQELRRSSSEANSISGTLPRINGSASGGHIANATKPSPSQLHSTLPTRPQRHQYFNNNHQHNPSHGQLQLLQKYGSPPRLPREKLLYHSLGSGGGLGHKANSLPAGAVVPSPVVVHGGGVVVEDMGRERLVNGGGLVKTITTTAWSESQASHTPLSNLSNLSEEEGEIL